MSSTFDSESAMRASRLRCQEYREIIQSGMLSHDKLRACLPIAGTTFAEMWNEWRNPEFKGKLVAREDRLVTDFIYQVLSDYEVKRLQYEDWQDLCEEGLSLIPRLLDSAGEESDFLQLDWMKDFRDRYFERRYELIRSGKYDWGRFFA